MSSAYGTVVKPAGLVNIEDILSFPMEYELKTGKAWLKLLRRQDGHLVKQTQRIMNEIIEEGATYPHEEPLDDERFEAYFLSNDAFVVVDGSERVLGAFYVKPNFPGRCSHICNGGFIVDAAARGQGVGRFMGQAFVEIAPRLGYKASMFNLVFVNNEASVKLWRSLGFKEIGRLPAAARLSNSDELVDALMFYNDFNE